MNALRVFVITSLCRPVKKWQRIIHHASLIYLGFAKHRTGFWHASTKWGLRTKDHAGRYRVSDYEDPKG
ncbi:MAG: hypothetical protein ACNYPD_06225 [Candidatus Halichondribacter symbioticus]